MSLIPANTILTLSQSSLQDYVDCPRRFQLRYLMRLAWPALEAEPALEFEKKLQLGTLYHRLIQQHQVGISSEQLSATIEDETLQLWWRNYLSYAQTLGDIPGAPGIRYTEITLTADLEGQILTAKYDLIIAHPAQKATIIDWKTSLKRPNRTWLADRLQTRLYPYLLVRAGAHLNNGKALQPHEVEIVYWFANFPNEPESFHYDLQHYQEDERYLASLIKEIALRQEEVFPLTSHEEYCSYCTYRSLCERGGKAGAWQEFEEPDREGQPELFIDFENIAEIEF
jgi:CRISPR/Cas system-associated exonuclease Cas4 (RecB family)